ncbi:hypothetical protein D3C72_1626310 [compost metagenome]
MQWRRVNPPRQCHGHQTQGETQRDQHQQFQPQARMHDQNQLAEDQAQVRSDHVAAEHQATLIGVRLFVEPALDHHVLAHHAQTDDGPQHQPRRQPIDQTVAKHRRPDDPGTGRISTDVPDPGNQSVTDLAAQHQTEIVGRHQRADPEAVDIVSGQTQCQISG